MAFKGYDRESKEIFRDPSLLHKNAVECITSLNNWSGVACDYIAENWGVAEALKFVQNLGEWFTQELYNNGGQKAIRKLKWFFDMEGAQTSYEEDENKVFLNIEECNTGGRMTREGVTRAWKNGMSIYCEHCPMWYDKMAKKKGINMNMKQALNGFGCTFTLYK